MAERIYNVQDIKKRKLWDFYIEHIDFQIQDLLQETRMDNTSINTDEIRGILRAIKSLCDDLDADMNQRI